MTTQLRNCCFWSCARRRENGKCPRENGSKQRHSSLFYSANASFRRDRATGPAHKIPDSPWCGSRFGPALAGVHPDERPPNFGDLPTARHVPDHDRGCGVRVRLLSPRAELVEVLSVALDEPLNLLSKFC